MSPKSMKLLGIGLTGAIVVAAVIYRGSGPETLIASRSVDGAPATVVGRDRHIQQTPTGEPDTIRQKAAASAILPVAASPGPTDASRPDAGNYVGNARPYGVSGFLFFFAVVDESTENTDASINKIREATKVDEDTAWRFLSYMTQARDLLKQYQLDSHNQLCAQRAQMTTIPQLANALKSTDAGVENRRVQLVRGAESILGVEGMRNFETYLSNKDRNQQQPFVERNEERLIEMNKTPAEVLALLCDQPSSH